MLIVSCLLCRQLYRQVEMSLEFREVYDRCFIFTRLACVTRIMSVDSGNQAWAFMDKMEEGRTNKTGSEVMWKREDTLIVVKWVPHKECGLNLLAVAASQWGMLTPEDSSVLAWVVPPADRPVLANFRPAFKHHSLSGSFSETPSESSVSCFLARTKASFFVKWIENIQLSDGSRSSDENLEV